MDCSITINEFKDFFDRGQFSFGTTVPDVRDKDITEAIEEASVIFNSDLYPSETICKKALLHLSAHYLQLDIEASENSGCPNFIIQSRSADGISESIFIPEWMKVGEIAQFATTYYGQKFLSISKPYLDGLVYSISGATRV